jgi:hypothetical protein
MPADPLPTCFEPYLRYAISTDFRSFKFFDYKSFDNEDFKLFLLVELKHAKLARAFENAMRDHRGFAAEFGPDVGHTRYATMRCRKAAVGPGAYDIWKTHVSRVELSLPVMPSPTPRGFIKGTLVDRSKEGKNPPGSLLIGVLDDGCPFAAAQFLKAYGAVSTRVRGIWDQNRDKQPIEVNDRNHNLCRFGRTLQDFNYGIEFRRDFAAAVEIDTDGLRLIGLDEWIGLHSTPAGIDEDGCYADAQFKSLARGQSHGGHVMDVFAGRVPTSSRVGPSPPHDRRDPPNWKPATDDASKADVVFVQFSEDCVRDATGVWLKSFVLNGIQYILSFADPAYTKNVVINLSYGPTTGPHDGTAELEAALTALVSEFDGINRKPKLEIVLAAGNAYLSEGHVVYVRHRVQDPNHVKWTWRLPPDNTVLSFAEVWMKKADASRAMVTLTTPSGVTTFKPTPPPPNGGPYQQAGVDLPIVRGDNKMWRLQVEPTIAGTNTAEHGDWTIEVTGIGTNAHVHAYVARSDPNMGVRTGAKRSNFVDPEWERTRSAEASCKYVNGEFDKTGSLVHRFGTLNGIATASDASVHVAGGYILSNGRKSPYSSAGPARSGVLTPRRLGPDYALPCDESYALQGIRAGANRSGGVFRLTGTSAAAPQLARYVAGGAIPPAANRPTTPDETYKRGAGNLEPP